MLAQGPVLGCPASDPRCLCSNPNFGYGIRDCAMQACSPVDAQQVIVYGLNYCSGGMCSLASTTTFLYPQPQIILTPNVIQLLPLGLLPPPPRSLPR